MTKDISTNPQTPKRRDPLNEVVDDDLLAMAHAVMMDADSTHENWDKFASIPSPADRMPFENVRLAATFVLPLALLALTYFEKESLAWVLGMTPVAMLLGVYLHARVRRALNAHAIGDSAAHRIRYRAQALMVERLGLRPEEVTLARIEKMNQDYLRRAEEIERNIEFPEVREKRERSEMLKTQAAESAARNRPTKSTWAGPTSARGGAGARERDDSFASNAVLGLASLHILNNFGVEDTPVTSTLPDINPGSNLPMIQDTPVDMMGNMYGTDSNSSFSSGSDFDGSPGFSSFD